MANKILFQKILILILLIFAVTKGFSQSQKITFSQTLKWESEAKAFEYKVEIKDAAGKITRRTTKRNSLTVSLHSGNYEWRVTAYDFLGREASQTKWTKFTIRKAIEPKVKTVAEEIVTGESTEIAIPLETKDTESEAKFSLINENGKVVASGKLQDEKIVFPQVPDGKYKVRVTNPGGKYADTAFINVMEKTPEQIPVDEAEEARLAEEKRKAEQAEKARLAEEKQKAEEAEKARLAEEKRKAEEAEKARLAEEQRKADEAENARLAEEQRKADEAEESQIAEEKQTAKEEGKNKGVKEFYIMASADYLLCFGEPQIFFGKNSAIGGDLKIEYLPFTIGKFKLGFNLEAQVFPSVEETSFLKEFMLFVPIEINVSAFYPIKKDKILVGAQLGGGILCYMEKIEFQPMEDGYKRDDIQKTFINSMFDVGLNVRFIIVKHFAVDISPQFEIWHIDDKFKPNVSLGVAAGLRL